MPAVRSWLDAEGLYDPALDSLNLGCNGGRGDFGAHAIVDGVLVSFCPFLLEGNDLRQRNAAVAATDGFDALLEAVVPGVEEGDLFEERALPTGAAVGCATLESVRTAKVASGREKDAHDVAEIDRMALPPCHALFQFYVADGRLSCQLYQRSADVFLGVPFNIASYALLTMMIAQVTGLVPGEFVHTLGDAHIYLNHREQVALQLTRTPRPLPVMRINPDVRSIFGFRYEDFSLDGYDPYPSIKAPVAV